LIADIWNLEQGSAVHTQPEMCDLCKFPLLGSPFSCLRMDWTACHIQQFFITSHLIVISLFLYLYPAYSEVGVAVTI
jgi:hypothetical protein